MLRYGLARLQPEIGGACRKLIGRCSSNVRRRLSTSPGAKESSSFMMNMFLGRIKPDEVFPYPEVLNADDVELTQSLSDSSNNLFKEIDSVKLDEQGFLDDETLEKLRNSGSWGVQVPVEYGGMGLNNTQLIKMAEISGNNDVGIAIILGAHQGIGLKGIVLFGTEEQKNKYLPDLTSGKKIAAFALTEPSSGSDANSIRSKAVLSGDGSHYILNGSKLYISNGDIADVMTVFAQVPITDPKTGTTKNKVTAFIVERAFGGVTSGPREKKLGIRVSGTTEVFFDDVKIPKENVLGGEGAGFKIAMHILNAGRFAMAGTMSGIIQKCLSKVVGQVSTRSQFGRTLDSFGIIQEKVARMVIQHYVIQSMAYALAGSMDRGAKEYQIEAAIGKVYASEAAWDAVDESIQLFGGSGYMKSTGLEKILRDVRIFRIFEGTNEILRLLVALTGIQYAGGHLKELQSALKNPAANLGVIFGEGSKRALRMVGVNRSSQTLDSLVHPELNEEAKLLCRSVERFGMTIEDILKRYGKHVIEEQFLLYRVANAAMENYAMAVTLSRATRSLHNNAGSAQHELDICKVFCYESERKTERLLEEVRKGSKMEAIYPKLTTISKNFVANAGIIYTDPLGCH